MRVNAGGGGTHQSSLATARHAADTDSTAGRRDAGPEGGYDAWAVANALGDGAVRAIGSVWLRR